MKVLDDYRVWLRFSDGLGDPGPNCLSAGYNRLPWWRQHCILGETCSMNIKVAGLDGLHYSLIDVPNRSFIRGDVADFRLLTHLPTLAGYAGNASI